MLISLSIECMIKEDFVLDEECTTTTDMNDFERNPESKKLV